MLNRRNFIESLAALFAAAGLRKAVPKVDETSSVATIRQKDLHKVYRAAVISQSQYGIMIGDPVYFDSATGKFVTSPGAGRTLFGHTITYKG